jgi:hypothetical protein
MFDLALAAQASAKQELPHKRAPAPIAHVQRAGPSTGAPTRLESALAEARAKLKPSMSAREAADYLIARRAAR